MNEGAIKLLVVSFGFSLAVIVVLGFLLFSRSTNTPVASLQQTPSYIEEEVGLVEDVPHYDENVTSQMNATVVKVEDNTLYLKNAQTGGAYGRTIGDATVTITKDTVLTREGEEKSPEEYQAEIEAFTTKIRNSVTPFIYIGPSVRVRTPIALTDVKPGDPVSLYVTREGERFVADSLTIIKVPGYN